MTNRINSTTRNSEPSDHYVERNRGARQLVLALTAGVAILGGYFLGGHVVGTFFADNSMMRQLGSILGLGIGVFGMLSSVERYFIIRNNIDGFLVTQDGLATIFGKGDGRVFYGPGFHISFPWEIRDAGGNITLREVANNISFTIQCPDGVIEGFGSYRLRPDMKNPIRYLTGVASVESQLEDLIVSAIRTEISGLTVLEALRSCEMLQKVFDSKFTGKNGARKEDNVTDFEERFGIELSDISVAQLLPTPELSRTISAIGEAHAIFLGTAAFFGLNYDEAKSKLESKDISQSDWNNARDRFLSTSGNLEGLKIDRKEVDFNIRGLEKESLEAIATILNNPEARNLLTAATGVSIGGKKGGSE